MILVAGWTVDPIPFGCVTIIFVMGLVAVMIAGFAPAGTAWTVFSPCREVKVYRLTEWSSSERPASLKKYTVIGECVYHRINLLLLELDVFNTKYIQDLKNPTALNGKNTKILFSITLSLELLWRVEQRVTKWHWQISWSCSKEFT